VLVEVKKVMAISSIPIMVVMSDEAEDVAMDMSIVLVVAAAIVMVLISIL
jgi:hypothetical protein